MNKLTFEKTQGAFTKARIFHYYALPVKKLKKVRQEDFIKMVDDMLDRNEHNYQCDITKQQDALDVKLYILYKLTYDEVRIIDPQIESIVSEQEYNKRLNNA